MNRTRPVLVLLPLSVNLGCVSMERAHVPAGANVPLFDGMGNHHRKVTTSSPLAQRYFDQGLVWTYAFNHDEAIRSYTEAARLDPDCAMAWWGIALCNGPHINNPMMDAEHSRAAWEAIQKARAAVDQETPVERALIDALIKRYADPAPSERRPLDEAYASAMGDVHTNHPEDNDVAVLYVEAMMDLQPWDLWSYEGKPKGNTERIVAVLEEVMKTEPSHPGAVHLYIHAVEASPRPERAVAAADRLRNLVPASGHLVHMPSHIDVQVGDWRQASAANVRAIEADRRYRAVSPRQGFYHVYMAHNHHFLSFASMMEGHSAEAVKAARAMIAGVPAEFAEKNAALVDGYMPIALDAMMRFGQWDDILAEPAPPTYFPITTSLWHFTRGIAYAAKAQVDNAEKEQIAFREAVSKVPPDALMAINPAHKVLSIAGHMLEGEIAFRRGQTDVAVAKLTEAVKIEDDLLYMEPPDWIQPVRHTLGAVLVHAGRYEEAAEVYRADLIRWPENGWSLYGLAQCLRALGTAEADDVEKRFRKAWSRADVKIGSSCLCTVAKT